MPVASISLSLKPGSTIKISSVRLPTQTDADYWVEIFARDETTLDGYKLEITEDAPLPPFKLYFTFPQGTILRAGKRLRIGPTPAARREWGIGYLTGEQTQLTAKTTWIRLSDNTGQVIHLQVVQPDANYAAPLVLDLSTTGLSNGLLLPNADGTRTLLLLKDLAGLAGAVSIPNGAYSLIFEFLRDIGQEAPVLREAGLTTLELATLLFSLR